MVSHSVSAFSLRCACVLVAFSGALLAERPAHAAGPTVAINEVQYHPADDSREGEFIELYNYGDEAVDLGNWSIGGGARFVFLPGTSIPPGGFLLIAASRDGLMARYEGLDESLIAGEYEGSLENNGELLRLWTDDLWIASFVSYGDGEPWAETPDGLGPSLERISSLREESDPLAWAASIPVGGTPGAPNSVRVDDPRPSTDEPIVFITTGEEWSYFRGTEEPPADWRDPGFDDSGWERGPAGFGYGDNDDATVLDDMPNTYVSVYIRHAFDVEDVTALSALFLEIDYDDGFVAYLNGVEVARRNLDDTAFDAFTTQDHEAGTPEVFPVLDFQQHLVDGRNVVAIAGHNGDPDSSDFTLHPQVHGTLRGEEEPPPPPPTWEPVERDVVINEVQGGAAGTGFVELFNRSAQPVDVSGAHVMVFPRSLAGATLPQDTVLAPGAFLVLSEAELGFEVESAPVIIFATSDGRFVDAINPRTTDAAHSTGRFPNGDDNRVVFETPTPGGSNPALPESPIAINEIMYHPSDESAAGEFVELVNRSTEEVDISGWSFTRGLDYTFAEGTVVPAGGFVVLARDPDALKAHYGLETVHGPYEGRLQNDAETLLLRDALRNERDRVRYADEGSWPEDTDGLGPSAELVHPSLENRWGPAWAASDGDGTPGAPNSRLVDDPAPIVVDVSHAPLVPRSDELVQIQALASDERGITAVSLFYLVDGSGGQPTEIPMLDDGVLDDGVPGNGVFGAFVPEQPNGSVVAFWVRAEAVGNETVTVPAGAPQPAFLYQVDDDRPELPRPEYRVVMRAANLNALRTRGNNNDNLLDLTFIGDGKAYYNRGIRYRGSSARSCNPLSYRVQFDHDVDLHGIKRVNLNGCSPHRQWIGLDFLRRTGIPTPQAWFRQVSLNGALVNSFHLRVESVDDAFLERTMAEDADGNLYRGVSQANLDYRGDAFNPYRNDYRKVTNETADDYSDVVDLCFRFDDSTTADEDFPPALEVRVDTFQWTSYFAAYAILGSTENSILLNNGDDYFLYHRFSDDKWMLLPWDLDSCFDDENQALFRPTVDAIVRFLQHPLYAQSYWCDLEYFLNAAFDELQVNSRIDVLAPLFPPNAVNDLRRYVPARRQYIVDRMNTEFSVDGASGGAICSGVLYPVSRSVRLNGRAPGCGTTAVFINGEPTDWNPLTMAWSGVVDVTGLDTIRVEAVNSFLDVIGRAVFPVDEILGEGGGGERPETIIQDDGATVLAFKAIDYQEITDPDEDGNVWGEAAGAPGALGLERRVMKAPPAGVSRNTGQSSLIYRVQFRTPGTYRSYYRMRGFGQDTDSVWRPTAFDTDPDIHLRANRSGVFVWFNEGDFPVSAADVDAGRVFEFRIGVREFDVELDAIAFSLDNAMDDPTLDGFVRESGAVIEPRPIVAVTPATDVELIDGAATVTLDASGSHDGQCGTADLAWLWEKTEGPNGFSFRDDSAAPTVDVELREPGTFVFQLTLTNTSSGTETIVDATVVVSGEPAAANTFLRCDANGDGSNGISDASYILNMLFVSGPELPCRASGDCNSDGGVNVSDAIFDLNFLFQSGPRPAAPYPACDEAAPASCEVSTCAQ